MAKIDLIIIDPQYDFCASASDWDQMYDKAKNAYPEILPHLPPRPALSVLGADKDMERVGNFLRKNKSRIDDVHITLDSHQFDHIAHPIFWKNPQTGEHPAFFTQITAADVHSGKWMASKPGRVRYSVRYVEELEKGGRYPLFIWPPHCLIGTHGQTLFEPIRAAVAEYVNQGTGARINYVTKGSNFLTEHYSAICAEVDPTQILNSLYPNGKYETDPSVKMNVQFLEDINKADKALICGEAGSHCLANTFRDAVNFFKGTKFASKLVLLTDGTSPVTGCESFQDKFINEMVSLGMEKATTDTFQF